MNCKKVNVLTLVLGIALVAGSITYGQTVGKPGGNSPNFFTTDGSGNNDFGGQLGHRQSGPFGIVDNPLSRWIAIGQPNGVPEEVYGMRIQDREYLATFSLNGTGRKDLEIQWGPPEGGNQNTRLNFNFAETPFTTDNAMSIDRFGIVRAGSIVRSQSLLNASQPGLNVNEYCEIGHGGASAYINAVGDGFLDFRLEGQTRMRLTELNQGGQLQGQLGINRLSVGSNFRLDVGGNTRTVELEESSDRRFKENIVPLRDEETLEQGQLGAMTEKLLQLEGVTYQFKKEQFGDLDLTSADDKTHIGFIAQDLEEFFPELVSQDEEGFYSVRYTGLIPVLVEGLKDQQGIMDGQAEEIDVLNDKIERLQKQMANVLEAIN